MSQFFDADIAMFVHNAVANDARVIKEATSLSAHGWRVVVVGVSLSEKDQPPVETVSGFTIIRIMPRFLRRSLPGTFGKLLRLMIAVPIIIHHLRRTRARVYHGHDFVGLLVMALAGIWRRPVVYDSHELFFDQYPKGLFTYPFKYVIRLMRPLEKLLARRAAAVITVSDGIADILTCTLKIERPLVIRNAVDIRRLSTAVPIVRPRGQTLLAHTGNLVSGRHLTELVGALTHVPDDVTLLFIGAGPLKQHLIAQAESNGVAHRLMFVPPVPPEAVSSTLAQADAAAVLTSPGYEGALPNKFFEAVAAGLPVIGTPLHEVERLILQYDLGSICDPYDPISIAQAVSIVLQPENRARYRHNAQQARQELCWEVEEQKLVALYQTLVPPHQPHHRGRV